MSTWAGGAQTGAPDGHRRSASCGPLEQDAQDATICWDYVLLWELSSSAVD